MTMSPLDSTVAALLVSGKGILAADESFSTIGKRFEELNIPVTEENRRAYRELLFATPGLSEFISGVILFDETMRQRMKDGSAMPEFIAQKGMVPGIKVDKGTIDLANFPGEKMTLGLDGLRERLAEYRGLGARFTKWRAVLTIGAALPSWACIAINAMTLATFAALSQEAGLVPIVEPEVLMTGEHSIERCSEVTTEVLEVVFNALSQQKVGLEQMLLKTGMVLSGSKSPAQADAQTVARETLQCLRRTVPAAVPGVVFLSGGQSDVDATERLNAICAAGRAPWTLSFSYGRALQAPALKKWSGNEGNLSGAQAALFHRAKCNSLAVLGQYSEAIEKAAP